jgi:DNA-binding HxlR family transcriptional regulator
LLQSERLVCSEAHLPALRDSFETNCDTDGLMRATAELANHKSLAWISTKEYDEWVDDDTRKSAAIRCDAALTSVFALLGKRWTGVVIGVLLERPARFAEIARAIPGIAESMLSARLAELKDAGLVTREVLEGPPIASLYRLTPSGEALRPALLSLGEWAQAHLGAALVAPR